MKARVYLYASIFMYDFFYDSQMLFNPLEIILNQNKLTRPNYVDWKRNLDIVLTVEAYKYVLTEECLDLSIANAPRFKRERYKNGLKLMRWHIAIF